MEPLSVRLHISHHGQTFAQALFQTACRFYPRGSCRKSNCHFAHLLPAESANTGEVDTLQFRLDTLHKCQDSTTCVGAVRKGCPYAYAGENVVNELISPENASSRCLQTWYTMQLAVR